MTNDHWSLKQYQSKNSPETTFFRKNLSPAIERKADYGFIVYLTFCYKPKDASGLPFSEDNAILSDLERGAFIDFEADRLAIHVATVTGRGVKDFLFYTHDAEEFLQRAERYRSMYLQFEVGCEISPDPEWKQYKNFP